LEAQRQKRPYSVWTDNVISEFLRLSLSQKSFLGTMYWRLLIPVIEQYTQFIIRRSSLGLFHGRDCYNAYAKHCSNPYVVHDIHTKASDQINAGKLSNKCEEIKSGGKLQIIYAGRMEEMKGPLDWIEIIHRLHAMGIPLQATWYGDGSLRKTMEDKVRMLGLLDVISLPGYCSDRTMLLEAIKSHHLFLCCHKLRESPRCLVESLICGTPIVGYESDYAADLISTHGGGILTPANDIEAATLSIQQLYLQRNQLSQLVMSAAKSGSEFNDEAVFRHRSELMKRYLTP